MFGFGVKVMTVLIYRDNLCTPNTNPFELQQIRGKIVLSNVCWYNEQLNFLKFSHGGARGHEEDVLASPLAKR